MILIKFFKNQIKQGNIKAMAINIAVVKTIGLIVSGNTGVPLIVATSNRDGKLIFLSKVIIK
jgi:hypothetical protein